MSQRRVAAVIAMHRTALRYQPTLGVTDAPLKKRTCKTAGVRVRYGDQRITTLLRRENWLVNHERGSPESTARGGERARTTRRRKVNGQGGVLADTDGGAAQDAQAPPHPRTGGKAVC